jgi:hypothetical protein
MNSNGDKLYMKLVAFDEIYNSVVQFSFEVILRLKKLIYVLKNESILGIRSEHTPP